MNEPRIRPWSWFAILWISTVFLVWFWSTAKLGLYGAMMAAFGLVFVISLIGGFIGGYHRSWRVTLVGTPTLVIAIMIGGILENITSGLPPFGSNMPNAKTFLSMMITGGLMLTGASVSHSLVSRMKRRHPSGHCQSCGYNLRGNTSGVCSECGTPLSEEIKATRANDESKPTTETPEE